MEITSTLQIVPLPDIDLEDKTYCLTLWEEPCGEELLTSIRRVGILQPPLLQQSNSHRFRIISGRKRISAARSINQQDSIPCRVAPPNLEKDKAFALLLEDTAAGNPLSLAEQIVFFQKLLTYAPIEVAIPMLTRMGLKPQRHVLHELLQFRQLCTPVLRAMHNNIIGVKTARRLNNFSETDQSLLVRLITSLHLGGSKQQKLIEFSWELVLRNNSSLKEILDDYPSPELLESPVNVPQQGSALLSWLERKCFPQLIDAEKRFQQRVARLDLPATMRVDHAPAFENDEITLSLRLSRWHLLNQVIEDIKQRLQKK